jgi:hypothetical protein
VSAAAVPVSGLRVGPVDPPPRLLISHHPAEHVTAPDAALAVDALEGTASGSSRRWASIKLGRALGREVIPTRLAVGVF